MTYNPAVHHRRSIRLKGYDYTRPGAYFVTIVTQRRECLFGDVVDGEMRLNDAGRMVKRWWVELENKYPRVTPDACVVMPNHFHGIVIIADKRVGADLRVCPGVGVDAHAGDRGAHTGAPLRPTGAHAGGGARADNRGARADNRGARADNRGARADNRGARADNRGAHADNRGAHADNRGAHADNRGAHAGAPLPEIVQWFKTMTTNEYIRGVKTLGWASFPGKLWQRNYYEHIVRDDASLDRIRQYIVANPMRWDDDDENPGKAAAR